MIRIPSCMLVVILCAAPVSAYAQQKGKGRTAPVPHVAVLNFTNNTGDKTLQYLASSIPEMISATLAQVEGLRVVERANLSKLLNEIELQQSGLFSESDTAKVGKMSKADALVIGSIGGTADNIVVTIKAVEVSSGRIIDGKVIVGGTQKIFEMSGPASLAMGAVISGKNLGYITVSTNPDGCDVYIDGIPAGQSPLIGYKTSVGEHRIVAVKKDHIEAETELTVGKDEHARWQPTLAKKTQLDRGEMGFIFSGSRPFTSKFKTGFVAKPYLGKTYEHFYIGFGLNIGYFRHDQDLSTPFGTVTHNRRMILTSLSLDLNYVPFTGMRYFSPYFGGFVEAGMITLSHKKDGEWKGEGDTHRQPLYGGGLTGGLNFFPYSRVSLFLEGRLYFYPGIERNEYSAPGFLGALQSKTEKFNLTGLSLGLGVKYYFK